MRNQEWDPAFTQLHTLDPAELVFRLLSLNAVDGEATLCVVDQAEVLARLFDRDNVHESGRVGHVGTDFAVNFDQTLHDDRLGFAVVQSVLETNHSSVSFFELLGFHTFSGAVLPVANENDQRETVPSLVRSGRRLGSIGSGHLVQEPVAGRTKALLVLHPV